MQLIIYIMHSVISILKHLNGYTGTFKVQRHGYTNVCSYHGSLEKLTDFTCLYSKILAGLVSYILLCSSRYCNLSKICLVSRSINYVMTVLATDIN